LDTKARGARIAAVLAVLLVPREGAAAPGDPPPGSGAARWGADYFPNVELVSHEGRTVRFFDDLIAGKVVVVNFIYTSCPDACPLETAKLVEVQDLLGERVGGDVFFYSISIDPERDTPAVLREYAERFQVGPGWLFLTGDSADIRLLRQKLGLLGRGEESLSDHTLNLLIGNQATGQWMKTSAMENPYLLASKVGSWLSSWKLPPEPGLDYADAPALRSISRGESLFRTRCSACHAIGADDGLTRQGPDLLGVTERRERAWLARWLAEPDAMLAEGDPLALELFEANRKLPMPNMRLNPLEVEALLGYMAEESAYVLERRRAAGEGHEPEEGGVAPCCQKEAVLVLHGADQDAPWARVDAAEFLAAGPLPSAPSAGQAPRSRTLPVTSLLISAGLGLTLVLLHVSMARAGSDA
jgi:protein SCO1/2